MAIQAGPFETILLAELRLGLPPLFYWQLHEIKDDWALVLKLHALFEGTLSKLITEKIALRKIKHEHLTPYDTFVSRVQLAERLKLIEPDYKNYLVSLNRLRNDITHNIRFINLRLQVYFDSLSERDFSNASRGLGAGFKNTPLNTVPALKKILGGRTPKHTPTTVRELFMCILPKITIWYSGSYALDLLSLHFHFEEIGDSFHDEPEIEAKLQDLLLDPEVIAFKKKFEKERPGF
jgi:hypothetical protein